MTQECIEVLLKDITLTVKGKPHVLKPCVRVTLCVSDDISYLLLDIVKEEKLLASGCLEAKEGMSRFAFADGRTCCVSGSGTRLLRALFDALGAGLGADNFDSLPQCLAFARNALSTPAETASLLRELGAECDEDGRAMLCLMGLDVSCRILPPAPGPAECAFRFDGKKEVPFREDVPLFETEGFPSALRRIELRLALEPSLAPVLPALILG